MSAVRSSIQQTVLCILMRFDHIINMEWIQVQEFNAQNFTDQADSAFHRDMVELAFSGFQRLQSSGAPEDVSATILFMCV